MALSILTNCFTVPLQGKCKAEERSEHVSGQSTIDLFLKITGAFLTLKIWWLSSTYNDGFNALRATVKHVQWINNIYKLILHRSIIKRHTVHSILFLCLVVPRPRGLLHPLLSGASAPPHPHLPEDSSGHQPLCQTGQSQVQVTVLVYSSSLSSTWG